MTKFLITTGQNASTQLIATAKEWAAAWNLPYHSREKTSLTDLFQVADAFIVITTNGPVLHTPEGSHQFHMNLAYLRIKNLQNGKHDHMVDSLELKPGMSVLDCTLGLGTDAMVASFAVGPTGKVVGVESETLLAAITSYGLKHFKAEDQTVTTALRQVEVRVDHYEKILMALPDQSFDVVYFDPMFRHPVLKSSQFTPLRRFANPWPLSLEALMEAKRVAKERVVLKETRNSHEFLRLNCPLRCGGRYSRIQYGIWPRQVTL